MRDLITKHLESFIASDWNAYKAALADDCVYEELATKAQGKGADKLVEGMKRWKVAFPDLKGSIREVIVAGDRATIEIEWSGTHKGVLEGPMGSIPATGKYGTLPAVLLYTLRDNKIVEIRHYFDMLTILSQLGLAPGVRPAAAATEAPKPQPRH